MRRPRLLFLAAITFAFPITFVRAAVPAKPYILFVLSDDHSYPFLSCYGDTNVRTPAIDQLAAEGMTGERPVR